MSLAARAGVGACYLVQKDLTCEVRNVKVMH